MKIGILGSGNIARTMARTLFSMPDTDIELVAIAASSLEKSEQFAKEFGIPKAYGNYDDLAKDPTIDLVYVATIHTMHYEHAKLCISHKKHCLVEKPFTLNASMAKELFDLAKDNGVLIQEAMWTRYMPSAQYFSSLQDTQEIGDIHSIHANIGYNLYSVPRMTHLEMAGGALLDIGIYPIHFAKMIFQDQPSKPTGNCYKLESGVDAIDSITLQFPSGLATLHATMLAQTDRTGCIYGSKGYILVDNINNPHKVKVYNTNQEYVRTHDFSNQITGFEYEIRACKEAIERNELESPLHTHACTLDVLTCMDDLRNQWNLCFPQE